MNESDALNKPGRISSLDGIRALSVLLVFAAHAGLDKYVPGGFGVTVFFFLSGFLITTLLRQEYDKTRDISVRDFMLRRVLRIWPAFYIVLVCAIVGMALFDPGVMTLPAVLAQLLHVSNYFMIAHQGTSTVGLPQGTGVYWSLGVEEHFYLAFPWFYLGMQRLKLQPSRQAAVLWALCIAVLLWRTVLVIYLDASTDRTYMATDTRIDSILFGCALAVWQSPVIDRPALDTRLWIALVSMSALSLIVCIVFRNEVFRETLRYSIQGIALTFIFVAAIRFEHWRIFRLLNTKMMTFIGGLSFSMYLIHFSIIQSVERVLPNRPIQDAALSLALTVSIAWLIYMIVEKPCAGLRRRLHRRRGISAFGPESAAPTGST